MDLSFTGTTNIKEILEEFKANPKADIAKLIEEKLTLHLTLVVPVPQVLQEH